MIQRVSRVKGTFGMVKGGRPPSTDAKSPTRGTGTSNKMTAMATRPMAASGAGKAFVMRGVIQIIAIVAATSARLIQRVAPDIQTWCPLPSGTLNCSICAKKITIARPLTKPSMTGCGTIRINFPRRNTPARICRTPIRTTVAKRYCTPCCATKETITTARAPVAPEIMPGRPPKAAVINPTMKAA